MRDQLILLWQVARMAAISTPYHLWRVVGTALDRRGGRHDQAAARGLGRALTRYLRLDVEVIGAEHLTGLEDYVVFPNHSSYLDWAVILGHFPVAPRFVAKRQLSSMPVVGSYLRARGVLIERSQGREARAAIGAALEPASPWPLLIFPEGTRSPDGQLLPFKRAGISLVAASGKKMVPVALVGTWEAFSPQDIYVHRGSSIRIVICEPVDPQRLGAEAACDAVEAAVHAAYTTHRGELAAARLSLAPASTAR